MNANVTARDTDAMIVLMSDPVVIYRAMVELPEDTNPEFVRDDVVIAVREVYNERAMFDLGRPQLPSFEALNFTPVPSNSAPVVLS